MQTGTPVNQQTQQTNVLQAQQNVVVSDNKTTQSQPVPADTYVYEQPAKIQTFQEKGLNEIPHDVKILETTFLQKEREYLAKSLDFLNRLNLTNKDNIEQEKKEVAQIEAELKNLEPTKKKAEEEVAASKKLCDEAEIKAKEAKDELFKLASQRNEAVSKIVYKEISGLKVKDKNAINDIFRFLNHIAYNLKGEEYNWSTFKKTALGKDSGADFFQRLKNANFGNPYDVNLLNAAVASKTNALAEFEKKNKQNASLRAMYDYAETFQSAANTNKKIADADNAVASAKLDLENKTKALQQVVSTHQAIEAKLTIFRKYQAALEQINTLVENTTQVVEQKKYEAENPGEEPKAEVKSQSPEMKDTQEQAIVGDGTATSPKKERLSAGVDFAESPSVEKKEGGACEGCNIF